MNYVIIADGSSDLGVECAQRIGVEIVPFYVSFDDKNYEREMTDIKVRDFYDRVVKEPTVYPKSSMPSVQDYIDIFESHVKNGEAIISICITTQQSGSYNSAQNAKNMLLEDYPDAKIAVIDSTVNTVLEGIYVREAARMKADGVSFEENVANLERIKSIGRIIFTVGNLEYLIHGGRIGKAKGTAVNMLGIKPMIVMKDGNIFSGGIARNRRKSMEKVIEQVKDYFTQNGQKVDDYEVVVGYGYDYEEGVKFRDQLLVSMRTYSDIKQIDMYQIGATVSVHTGPYALGAAFMKKYDRI